MWRRWRGWGAPRRVDGGGAVNRGRKQPLWRPAPGDAVDGELAHHVEELTDRLVGEGLSRKEAELEARRRFGDLESLRSQLIADATSVSRSHNLVESTRALGRDLVVAIRNLRRRPGYGMTLVVTLGLGIAVITALFAIVDALLLRPLPYRDADRLLAASLRLEDGGTIAVMPIRQLEVWRESADFMEAVEAYEIFTLVRSDGPAPEYVTALSVTPGLDELLGLSLGLGRAFGDDDAEPGSPDVVMLTHGFWRRLGSPPDIVGRDMRLDGRPWTVVGVLPAEFKFPVYGSMDVWIPIQSDWRAAGQELRQASVVGRALPGLGLGRAQERADRLGDALQTEQPTRLGWSVDFRPVTDWRSNTAIRQALWLLVGATAVLLLIGIVNSVNLTLVRSWSRSHEMGIRQALGGSRAQLGRLVFVESAILGVGSGVAAVLGARALMLLSGRVLPDEISRATVYDFAVGPRVLAFAFAITVLAGLVLGGVAAWRAVKASPLAERDTTPRRLRIRKVLIVVEVALSVVLIAGAAIFGRGFLHLLDTDLGYDPDPIARMRVSLPVARYSEEAGRIAFAEAAVSRLGQVPGVGSVALGDLPPDVGFAFSTTIAAEGAAPLADQPVLFPMAEGDEDYLDVMGIRVVAGRGFVPADATAADQGVRNVLIDRDLAGRLWADGNAIGRRFRRDSDGPLYTVIGLTERIRFMGPDDRMAPHGLIQVRPTTLPRYSLSFLIRVDGDPAAVLPDLASVIRELDPELPIRQLDTGRQALGEALETPRLLVTVFGTLAAVAAILTATGLFGVLAYAVSRRTREMGIRMAVGATGLAVRRQLLREGLLLGTIGAGIGIAVSTQLARFARALLYEVSPVDPLALAAVGLLTVIVAVLAALVPANRAGRVEPMAVLRTD
jgi:putative ABC transport system permease protein